MCGYLFALSANGPIDRARFEKAFASIAHRGPDHSATRYETHRVKTADGPREIHAGFGHHRLSILDLDKRSNQPYAKGRQVLLYNGEIYNFAELRGDVAFRGINWETSGDTELVYETERRGARQVFDRFNGFWSTLFFDPETSLLHLSRDRYGKKPLFWYLGDRLLCVASTIRSIIEFVGERPRFEPEMLRSFIAHGALFPNDGEDTHFSNIRQVPPRARVTFDIAAWSMSWQPYFSFSDRMSRGDLVDVFKDAVRLRLVSDRKVGLLLSGGVDSTAVLSALHAQQLHQNIHCFIGEAGRSEDAQYARRCADQLGIEATVIELGYSADAFQRFKKMCRHFEKPFPILGNSMAMSEMYERIAEHNVPVVIDGTGGDEIFGGYWDRQYPFAVREAWRKGDRQWLWLAARRAGKPFRRAIGADTLSRALKSAMLALPFVKHKSGMVKDYCAAEVLSAKPLDPLAEDKLSFTMALIADVQRGRLGEWIWHNDRNSMMASIENRSPLLDYRLSAWLESGYSSKLAGEWNKYELRSIFDALVPLPTQWRVEKQGFRWAGGRFYRENVESIVELIDASNSLRGFMNVDDFCNAVRKTKDFAGSRLGQRALCVAGIEAELGAVV